MLQQSALNQVIASCTNNSLHAALVRLNYHLSYVSEIPIWIYIPSRWSIQHPVIELTFFSKGSLVKAHYFPWGSGEFNFFYGTHKLFYYKNLKDVSNNFIDGEKKFIVRHYLSGMYDFFCQDNKAFFTLFKLQTDQEPFYASIEIRRFGICLRGRYIFRPFQRCQFFLDGITDLAVTGGSINLIWDTDFKPNNLLICNYLQEVVDYIDSNMLPRISK